MVCSRFRRHNEYPGCPGGEALDECGEVKMLTGRSGNRYRPNRRIATTFRVDRRRSGSNPHEREVAKPWNGRGKGTWPRRLGTHGPQRICQSQSSEQNSFRYFAISFAKSASPTSRLGSHFADARGTHHQAGRSSAVRQLKSRPGSLPPKNPPTFWPVAPDNTKEGGFRLNKRHFTRSPAETFRLTNGLAANRPQSSDVTGPSRYLVGVKQ
jgi:hypothetical protein